MSEQDRPSPKQFSIDLGLFTNRTAEQLSKPDIFNLVQTLHAQKLRETVLRLDSLAQRPESVTRNKRMQEAEAELGIIISKTQERREALTGGIKGLLLSVPELETYIDGKIMVFDTAQQVRDAIKQDSENNPDFDGWYVVPGMDPDGQKLISQPVARSKSHVVYHGLQFGRVGPKAQVTIGKDEVQVSQRWVKQPQGRRLFLMEPQADSLEGLLYAGAAAYAGFRDSSQHDITQTIEAMAQYRASITT